MNEEEFRDKWDEDKPIYEAWGEFVQKKICEELRLRNYEPSVFLKVPATPRLKSDDSLVDKAFYRPGKNYSDPYNEIEDKVGLRFVVLLLEDVDLLSEIIRSINIWEFDECKHYDEDKRRDPLIFTYQSVHYILRPRVEVQLDKITVPSEIPCEVQIRTLLQHAHAELTHDSIYKAKKKVQPQVHRTVAKSMALIETTDEFFKQVTISLKSGALEDSKIVERLDGLYYSLTGIRPTYQKSSIVIWDQFEYLVDEDIYNEIEKFINENEYLRDSIVEKYRESVLYQQSIILFIYWMLKKKRRKLLRDWPIEKTMLEPMATDMGISLSRD